MDASGKVLSVCVGAEDVITAWNYDGDSVKLTLRIWEVEVLGRKENGMRAGGASPLVWYCCNIPGREEMSFRKPSTALQRLCVGHSRHGRCPKHAS